MESRSRLGAPTLGTPFPKPLVGVVITSELVDAMAARIANIVVSAIDGIATTETPYMTVAEAAEYLRCDPQRVYDLASNGRLPRYKDGRRTLHRRVDVMKLVNPEP